jgi:LysR family transcriptional regulator, glycine cleavage system transcriptional activator
LSRSLLAVDALTSKELAVPFGPVLPQPTTYSLVYPRHLAKRRDVAAFRNWVLAEAQASAKRLGRILRRLRT